MRLTNKEIIQANQAFQRLNAIRFPILTTRLLVKAAMRLDKPMAVLEKLEKELNKKYTPKADNGNLLPILPGSLEQQGYTEEWDKVLAEEEDIEDGDKVKLPEVVAATCDKCKHNMDKPLEIEASILKPLHRFVE